MLHAISNQELEHLLTLDHPTWSTQAITQQAEEYRQFLDDRLEAPLRRYLDTGKPQQFQAGEFSLLLIQIDIPEHLMIPKLFFQVLH